MTISGAASSNYSLTQPTLTGNITARPVSITGVTAASKDYDGTTDATLSGGSISTGVGTETLAITTGTGTFADKNVGTKAVTAIGYEIADGTNGGLKSNYVLSAQPVIPNQSITAKQIAVTAESKTKVYGEADPALTYDFSPALIGGDTFTGALSRTAGENAGNYAINKNNLSLSSNYTITYTSADLIINKATLTVTADNKAKLYGSANPAFTYQYSGWKNGDDASDLATLPTASTTISETTSVGLYDDAITLAGATDENYDFTYFPADLEVTKATLTVTADAKTKVYGESNPALTYQYSGWKNDDDASDLGTEPTASTAVSLTTSTGIHDDAISVSGGADENYDFAYVPADFEVTKATLTVSADAKTKIYGSANPTLTFGYTGWKNNDDASYLATEPIVSTAESLTTSAGIHDDAISVSGGADENYDFTYTAADFEVTKATLTVTADSKTKIYGSANPTLTFGYSGWKNSDDASDLINEPSASTALSLTTSAGIYDDAITVSGGSDDNYDFTYVPADFEITKAMLTVTADTKTKVYGEVNPAFTYQYSGWRNDDNASNLTTLPYASSILSETTPAGTYDNAITLTGGADENYNFTYVPANFEVTKATLTITADAKTKVYGDVNPGLTLSYDGFKNADNENVIDLVPAVSSNVEMLTNAGNYPISLSGGADNNYDLVLVNGNFRVERAELKVTADDKTKIYGQANPALTIRYSGFVADQDQSVLDVLPSVSTDAVQNSDAGSYDILVSGAVDNNYSFVYSKGILEITKADQTITFSDIPDGLRTSQQHQLIATSTSGLPVSFEVSDARIGNIAGDILTIEKEGNLDITAIQEGDKNWNPAATVLKSIVTLPTFDNIMSLFTPNHDGVNDYWYIPEIEEYGNIAVVIYNRFGKKVYQSDNYMNDWEGTWNGDQLPSASYYYIIKSSKRGIIKGVVNIVR